LKLTIQQEDLAQSLLVVANVVPAKTTMPILTCVLLEAGDEGLRISATNLDISITTVTDKAKIGGAGRVAVPAAKFVQFVRSLGPGEVKIDEKDGRFRVLAGKSTLTESSMNADEFPSLPALDADKPLEIDSSVLVDMIRETAYAISKDETRPALMGIKWEIKSDSLAMIATDAHRLSRSRRELVLDLGGDRDLIADTQGLLHYARLAEGEEKTALYMGENQLSFGIGATVLHTRLLEGPFPDYTAVIPKNNELLMTVDRDKFHGAVRRVSITADRITSQIRLGLENDRLELSATGTDGSSVEDELAVGYQGAALEIGFNYTYLLDVLKNIRADDVQMAFRDPQSAALVRPVVEGEAGADLLCLLMPLRLTSD